MYCFSVCGVCGVCGEGGVKKGLEEMRGLQREYREFYWGMRREVIRKELEKEKEELFYVCGGVWWCVVVCGGVWWCVVVCGGVWWCVVVCGCVWLCVVVCGCVWLCVVCGCVWCVWCVWRGGVEE